MVFIVIEMRKGKKMRMIKIENLKDWKKSLRDEIEELNSKLLNVDSGSDEDFELSGRVGKKTAMIEGIQEEMERQERLAELGETTSNV